jgi:transcriptional regulator of NAD metabolism
LCRYCSAPIPEDLPPQSRYCRRSHRQRAHEARQIQKVTELRRELRRTQRLVNELAGFIDRLSEHPVYGRDVSQAYLHLVEEKLERSAAARAERHRASTT